MLPVGENLCKSVSIAVESKVELFSDAPDDQCWHSCGLAQLFTDVPKQSLII